MHTPCIDLVHLLILIQDQSRRPRNHIISGQTRQRHDCPTLESNRPAQPACWKQGPSSKLFTFIRVTSYRDFLKRMTNGHHVHKYATFKSCEGLVVPKRAPCHPLNNSKTVVAPVYLHACCVHPALCDNAARDDSCSAAATGPCPPILVSPLRLKRSLDLHASGRGREG